MYMVILGLVVFCVSCDQKGEKSKSGLPKYPNDYQKNSQQQPYHDTKFSIGQLKLNTSQKALKLNIIPSEKKLLTSLEKELKTSPYYDKKGLPIDGILNIFIDQKNISNKNIYTILINADMKLEGLTSNSNNMNKNVYTTLAFEHQIEKIENEEDKIKLGRVFVTYFEEFQHQLKQIVEVDLANPSKLGAIVEDEKLLPEARLQAIRRIGEEKLHTHIPSLRKGLKSNQPAIIQMSAKALLRAFQDVQSIPKIIDRMKVMENPDSPSYQTLVNLLSNVKTSDTIAYFKSLTDPSKPKALQQIGHKVLAHLKSK